MSPLDFFNNLMTNGPEHLKNLYSNDLNEMLGDLRLSKLEFEKKYHQLHASGITREEVLKKLKPEG